MSSKTTQKKLKQKFVSLRLQAEKRGLNQKDIVNVFFNGSVKPSSRVTNGFRGKQSDTRQTKGSGQPFGIRGDLLFMAYVAVLLSALCYLFFFSTAFKKSKCLFDYSDYTREMTRPLVNCDFCRNLQGVPTIWNITQKEFQEKYAYNLVPAVVKGATSDWQALKTFNFRFIGDLYNSTEGAFDAVMMDCMFHAYQTDFRSLEAVFSMPESRANLSKGETPWYIGWSNCHEGARKKLREHYKRPPFLPPDIDTSIVDWFFMGTEGQGALIHVDMIDKPSWQAQIAGKKTWTLVPPPECDTQCKTMNVTLEKGDILIVETNIWFHSTFVHPGELSIAVGSEYD